MFSCFGRNSGGHDKLLADLHYPDAARAWEVVCQKFINDCFPRRNGQFNAIPYLDANSCPCSPSTVILVRERSFKEWLLRKDRVSIMAGQFTDFYPPRQLGRQAAPSTKCPVYKHDANFHQEYQTRNGHTRVVVEVRGIELQMLSTGLKKKTTLIDLDNFDATGFHSDLFYLVTSTINVDKLHVSVRMGTSKLDSMYITAVTPIAFRAAKLSLDEETRIISHTKHFKAMCPLTIRKRSHYELLLNNLTPNQMRFGGAVGDKELIANEDGVTHRVLRQIYRTLHQEDDEPPAPMYRVAPYNPAVRPRSQESAEDSEGEEPGPRAQSA